MIKDIDISHYYKKFIETSNDDMAKYNKELEVIISDKLKNEIKHWLRDIQIKIKKEEEEGYFI